MLNTVIKNKFSRLLKNMPTVPPPTNNLVTPMLTDLYQITMAYGYWKTKRHNEHAVFELFFRKNPFQGSYTVFCGIDEVLKYVQHFRFTSDDIEYLKTVPALSHCDPGFFDYLSNVDCSEVTIDAAAQGSIVFPRTPLITVSGPLLVTQLLETNMLNLVNYPSLVATNASRMVIAARGQHSDIKVRGKTPKCVEFGLRRAQGPDGGFSASKYCMVGGFDAVANVQAGKVLGIPIGGTHAHSFVMSFSSLEEVKDLEVKKEGSSTGSGGMVNLLEMVLKYRQETGWTETNDGELAAFIAYGIAFPSSFLCLVDTYNTLNSGLKNFILVALALADCGYAPQGIRLDSGDLAILSLKCHELLDETAAKFDKPIFSDLDIVASDGINEKIMYDLKESGHGISVFGIGTNLVTCQAQPALGCVFKLVELDGKPRIKLSNTIEKVLIPGRKRVFRMFDENEVPQLDLLIEVDDEIPQAGKKVNCYSPFSKSDVKTIVPHRVEETLQTVWDKNGVVDALPSLMNSRERCANEIKALNPAMLQAKNPLQYDVFVSEKLRNDLHLLWESSKRDV